MAGYEARAAVDVAAPPERVWQALTDPDEIAEYSFGSRVTTDWQVGSPVSWDGEFNGKQYSDKGEVLTVEPGKRLVVTHFSPLMGKPDAPENYHTVSYTLSPSDAGTRLELVQDNAGSAEEAEHSSGTWQTMLDGLKTLAEKS